MTPDHLIELAKGIGLPAAILLFMWMNRAPSRPAEDKKDPAAQLAEQLHEMNDRLIAVQAAIGILIDRKTK